MRVSLPTDKNGLDLCGVKGTPEQNERHRRMMQEDYERQLARYLRRGGYGYF